MNKYRAKLTHIRDEILLSAADEELMGKELREGILHLEVKEAFYGTTSVTEEFLVESMGICTIGNFVGRRTVDLAIKHKLIERENTLIISGVPHAQFAKMIR
ncbi:MAG: DUF424 domain-containing protein [Cuniculiplasma sp.]